jgi:GrpB-like predicted nucleotidyltransferase (UPF0157 family)
VIQIDDYDAEWPERVLEISGILTATLAELAVRVEHVGSTSVPGLPAKPILDIDVVYDRGATLAEVVDLLATLGYEHQGDLGIPGREAFRRPSDDVPRAGTGRTWPAHHLYACRDDSSELLRHIAFRDYLRQHPETVREYGELKRRLAQRHATDREAYTEAKTEFVEAILRLAAQPSAGHEPIGSSSTNGSPG